MERLTPTPNPERQYSTMHIHEFNEKHGNEGYYWYLLPMFRTKLPSMVIPYCDFPEDLIDVLDSSMELHSGSDGVILSIERHGYLVRAKGIQDHTKRVLGADALGKGLATEFTSMENIRKVLGGLSAKLNIMTDKLESISGQIEHLESEVCNAKNI